jgi:hypothetical protein
MLITKLETQHSLTDFYEDISLLGLISFAKGYRFCWLLNNCLGYDFKLDSDKEIVSMKKNRTYYFPVYHYFDHISYCDNYIYVNKYEGEYLLPELKHLDYIWIIKGDKNFNDILPSIKLISEIQFSVPIELSNIQNKEQLIF